MEAAIVVEGMSKKFRRYDPRRPVTVVEALTRGLRRWKPTDEFWALRDVSFAVPGKRMVGLIGANGAGKSTLLRLIGGVGKPDAGTVSTQGRIGALLEIGAGFHPDLTGRENAFISGVISGLTRREVEARFDEIVAFAELEAFIDSPLRTYSTGMQMRLAFAVAVHVDPDILLIDEILAVGDLAFQRKCLGRIEQFKARGCLIVLVSHDLTLVQRLCDEVIWLRNGGVADHGPAELIVGRYTAEMRAETLRRTPAAAPDGIGTPNSKNRFGSLEVEITAVTLLDAHGQVVETVLNGRPLAIRIAFRAPQPVSAPIFGVTISREDGFACCDISTESTGLTIPEVSGTGEIVLAIERLDLARGRYFVDVGIYERTWSYAYDYHWHLYPLSVSGSWGGDKGILQPPHRWSGPSDSSPAGVTDF